MAPKYDPVNLTLDTSEYEEWFEKESDDPTVKNDEKEFYDLQPPERN